MKKTIILIFILIFTQAKIYSQEFEKSIINTFIDSIYQQPIDDTFITSKLGTSKTEVLKDFNFIFNKYYPEYGIGFGKIDFSTNKFNIMIIDASKQEKIISDIIKFDRKQSLNNFIIENGNPKEIYLLKKGEVKTLFNRLYLIYDDYEIFTEVINEKKLEVLENKKSSDILNDETLKCIQIKYIYIVNQKNSSKIMEKDDTITNE